MSTQLNQKIFDGHLPEAVRILNSDIRVALFHDQHGVRHPFGIYNVSISNVLQCFKQTIEAVNTTIKNRPFLNKANPDWEVELLARQKNLLYALMEHFDDCETILGCFFPTVALRNKDAACRAYKKAVEEYRDHIGRVANYLKHNHGQLRSVVLYDANHAVPGYFVEGTTDGILGPIEMIHNGGDTAFSFSRDLRFHFFNFFSVGSHLADAIRNLVGDKYVAREYVKSDTDKAALQLAIDISSFSYDFYADEIPKPTPTVVVEKQDLLSPAIVLKYPDTEFKLVRLPRVWAVAVRYRGDGVSKSFRLPYLKTTGQ